jgi:nucleotide-binding universal stress UspA family protein
MRRILVTTDGSENALKSSFYISDLYGAMADLEVILFTVYPTVPPLYREEDLNPSIRKQFSAWLKKREEEAFRHIEQGAKVLQKGGLRKNQILGRQAQQVVGVARDIIREMDAHKYDACVIGKKGTGWFEDYFLGSITGKLLEISENHPLWVVAGKGFLSRRVLIAMDEMEQTLSLACYAGKMLRGLAGLEILFYHFCSPFPEMLKEQERKKMRGVEKKIVEREKEATDHCFDEAQKILLDLGFEKNSILYKFDYDSSAAPRKVSQAVLRELEQGQFGTLILGRKGSTQAREFRMGSVALRLAAAAQNCAVWVV